MRHQIVGISVAAGLGAASLLAGAAAVAQPIEAGVNATPAALVLLDTSASMEWLDAQDEYPVCLTTGTDYVAAAVPCATDTDCAVGMYCDTSTSTCAFARSRYHAAVEVLTGSLPNYYTICDDRTSDSDRVDQFGTNPDQGIRHSIACTYLTGAEAAECYRNRAGTVIRPANFRQRPDGLIDLYGSFVHFGFMAYDSFPNPAEDETGMFSYGIEGWSLVPGDDRGACPNDTECWNLGGRGPGGTEGGAVAPIDPANDTALRRLQINNTTQNAVLGVVPYWSTPIEGILEDALTFYTGGEGGAGYSWYAANAGYATDAGAWDYSRGLDDPYEVCRDKYVILITDGLPTYDECIRRGFAISNDPWDAGCEGYWYADADYYAARLLDAGVRTYIIAFNLVVPAGVTDPVARLESIASFGGTSQVYFADGSRELLFQLGDILTQIAEGTPSRTAPVTTSQLAGDRLGQYRFDANFTIEQESKYWRGNVIRSGRECEDGALVAGLPVDAASRINARPLRGDTTSGPDDPRMFLTTSPSYHSCHNERFGSPGQSLFPASLVDLVTNPLTEPWGVTPSEISDVCRVRDANGLIRTAQGACSDLSDGDVGFPIEFDESNTQLEANCLVELDTDILAAPYNIWGAGNLGEATVFMRWLQGWTFTELRAAYQSELDAILPANFRFDTDTGTYPRDRTGRLADVFHSAPALVGAPDPLFSQDENYQAFATTYASRPTTLYVGTNDGLLHAFDGETLDEVWAFLPASFQSRIGEWITPGHTFMFDGSPQVANIALDRRVDDGTAGAVWRTVLVSGYRGGGRGFVALDVTDRDEPRWLWELDAELDPQLGYTYGEPDLGTVQLADCIDGSDMPCERGIAVLPGGLPPEGADPNSNIGRVLYVVDLKTGQVLRRITHYTDEDGNSVPFAAPLSGSVTLFDGFAGTLVSRGFFGDQNGVLYRLDLSSTDPEFWRVDLFFDPHLEIEPELGLPAGETVSFGEVYFRPTVAPYADYRAVVVYGMGNPDRLDDLGTDANFVVSAIETPEFDANGDLVGIRGELNWAVQLDPYEKMTSRPRVFNRRTFVSTFLPNSADLCEIGGARLYAFDYIGNVDGLPGEGYVGPEDCDEVQCYLAETPDATFDAATNPLVPFWDSATTNSDGTTFIPPKSIIHSLEIVQAPSCFLEEGVVAGTRGDSAASTRSNQADAGAYELQIGVSSYGAPDPFTGVSEAVSQIETIALESPPVAVIPTSWTSVFE